MATYETADRIYNFAAGPAVLPLPVLEQAQRELLALPNCGASVMEISHRSEAFSGILHETKESLAQLLNLPENYDILFLQGGARLQFSMVPMNILRGTGQSADFILTGSWGKKALDEAAREGQVHIAWDGKETSYTQVPDSRALQLSDDAAMVHMTSNETIEGVQFATEPDVGDAPLVCDASSDFLSRPLPMQRYGIIYACAQKNAGPAGVTLVVIRKDLLERSQETLPSYLNYAQHAKSNSLFNTPPSFAVYMVGLVAKWLQNEIGGLAAMSEINHRKAAMLYEVIDENSEFYRGHASPECRSVMNVTFRLPTEALEGEFVAQAARRGLDALKGHRSVGGIRASIYNAMPVAGVEKLRDYMREFLNNNA
ncbi:MAG: 3-phosphoserine/phosphohydroxythreonine transaminase [Planctomycetota bacterium]